MPSRCAPKQTRVRIPRSGDESKRSLVSMIETYDQVNIFYPLWDEASVSKGMTSGYVTDYLGKRVWDARSPVSDVISYICALSSLKTGDNFADIGAIAEDPAASR
jgi:hypothetical protein